MLLNIDELSTFNIDKLSVGMCVQSGPDLMEVPLRAHETLQPPDPTSTKKQKKNEIFGFLCPKIKKFPNFATPEILPP